MKRINPVMLALAMSSMLFVTACNRDRAAATAPVVDNAAPMATTAPPMEPATTPDTAMGSMPMDSGMSFADMDKNHDGGLALDEIADTEMLHQHFDKADTNHDGKLSQAEVDQHRAEMAAAPGS